MGFGPCCPESRGCPLECSKCLSVDPTKFERQEENKDACQQFVSCLSTLCNKVILSLERTARLHIPCNFEIQRLCLLYLNISNFPAVSMIVMLCWYFNHGCCHVQLVRFSVVFGSCWLFLHKYTKHKHERDVMLIYLSSPDNDNYTSQSIFFNVLKT